jgi:hypothetical protein
VYPEHVHTRSRGPHRSGLAHLDLRLLAVIGSHTRQMPDGI